MLVTSSEIITSGSDIWVRSDFALESDLEKSISASSSSLFGSSRIYLDIKRSIKSSFGRRSIPDGYLLDLSGHKPRLYVVENELASHDPIRHIAVQLLQFSMAFDDSRSSVQQLLFSQVVEQNKLELLERFASRNGYRNIDHVLHAAVYEEPFRALVIIDQIPEGLERSLTEKFKFSVDILEVARYSNGSGEHLLRFTPFLAEVNNSTVPSSSNESPSHSIDELDTIVVPARNPGFTEVFLGENRWYKIRISGTMRSQIRYVAAYQVAPVSAITHIAEIASIEPWPDSDKYVINFKSAAEEIGPLSLVQNGKAKAPQSIRYTNRMSLLNANNLDEIW